MTVKFASFVTPWQVLAELCSANNMFGIYCSVTTKNKDDVITQDELFAASPWLRVGAVGLDFCAEEAGLGFWHNRHGYFLFSTEQEMLEAYNQTVGDDGPTEKNQYDGPVRVYALTCDDIGRVLAENT